MPLLIKRPENVLGHSLPEPRITLAGALLLALAVSVPVLVLGSLARVANEPSVAPQWSLVGPSAPLISPC